MGVHLRVAWGAAVGFEGWGNLLAREFDRESEAVLSRRRVWYAKGFEEAGREPEAEAEVEAEDVDETELERSMAVVQVVKLVKNPST